jgi:hypothetical protein
MTNTTYNRSIRQLTIAFGSLFNNITLVRYNPDQSEQERFIVPIGYSSKERYVMRLQSDPDLDKKVQITLPRFSYEMNNMSYDSTRKQNTSNRTYYNSNSGVNGQYNPVPYDFDFSLYLYTRNIEDGNQIIEHITSYFTPDFTIKVDMVPLMGIVKEIPIILNSIDYEVDYEGDRENETRYVIWTLKFKVKGYIFGGIANKIGLIKTSITNLYQSVPNNDVVVFNVTPGGNGNYRPGEIVYQGYSVETAIALAKVISWDAIGSNLSVINIIGNFVSSQRLIGSVTNSNYIFNSYDFSPVKYSQIVVTPMATDSNANNIFVATTTIFETPNSNSTIVVTRDFSGDLNIQIGRDDLGIEQNNILDLEI